MSLKVLLVPWSNVYSNAHGIFNPIKRPKNKKNYLKNGGLRRDWMNI